MEDDYQERAQRHRPTTAEAVRAEVRRLHGDGWRISAIANALGLNDLTVAEMLEHSS
jgi:DNA invertase Pin-like site-specific DNA recombinase